ncbi:zinc finger BED domain-containing protein 1-like [Notothenia coriiceps]|uniref:Zinc finger BED domain-containing protein 1-like n=1 Tax=Notothenia coriiceps TaxID=8208 RepID=A0A6I9N839_9TELE|nr:PREDICTED: zinc finger BED domain-containing protein 1-like [Notothenia coriiceps]
MSDTEMSDEEVEDNDNNTDQNPGGDSGESEREVVLVPKKGPHSSSVWNFFGFDPDDDLQKVVHCKHCSRMVATTSGNTTNLLNHLQRHHKIQYALAKKDNPKKKSNPQTTTQTSISQTLFNGTPYSHSSRRHKEITKAITFYLAKDMASINTVQNEGFKNLMKTLDKRYSVPSRNYFSRTALPAMYYKILTTVETELKDVQHFATTTDLWSSRTMEPYMSLTVHFITSDFTMKSRCLKTAFFPVDHTGDEIAVGLMESLHSWSLDPKRMVCITTDSGSNIIKASDINKWTRLQCFGHRLHLAIAMVNRVLGQQEAITRVLARNTDRSKFANILTWQDIQVLEVIDKTLTPLAEFTDALSGEQYVSVSSVKPVLHLFESLMAVKEDDPALARSIKTTILQYLQEKYSDPKTQALLDIATSLDPRFKLDYVSEDNKTTVKTRLKDEMTSIVTMPASTQFNYCT